MAKGDFDTRIERAKEFLNDGYRVKLVVKFSGRQLSKRDFGLKLAAEAITTLSDLSIVEQEPKWQGKLLVSQLKPKKISIPSSIEDKDRKDE